MPKTSLVLTVAALALLAIPAHSSAQTTTNWTITATDPNNPQFLGNFRNNDVLTLTSTLHAADMSVCPPLFPALFVNINFNNGLHWTQIFQGPPYEVPITASIVLDQGDGFLTASVRCVTADLGVTLQHPSKWSPEKKAAAARYARSFNGWNGVFGAAQIPCALIPGPAGLSCKVTAGLFQAASAGAAWYMSGIALDPSDPNFMVIAQPVPIVLPSGMDCGAFTECNNLLANDLQIISLERAILTTNDRIQGAIDAGDTFWEDQQTQALRQYQIQLASLASQNATLTQSYQAAFQARMAAAGATPIVVSAADIATFQSNTQAGWTFDQQNVFTAMGFTPQEMDAIAANTLAQDTSTLPGDYPEILTRGDFYSTVGAVITSMGDGTQPIPVPSVSVSVNPLSINRASGKKITVALLASPTFTATQVAQNTITFGKTGYESTPLSCTNSDFNHDGRVDRVCTFASSAGQVFQLTDTVARVHFTYNGTRFLVSTSLTVTK
jgi:hypothetical protein